MHFPECRYHSKWIGIVFETVGLIRLEFPIFISFVKNLGVKRRREMNEGLLCYCFPIRRNVEVENKGFEHIPNLENHKKWFMFCVNSSYKSISEISIR